MQQFRIEKIIASETYDDVSSRIFQIVFKSGGEKFSHSGGNWQFYLGGFFYRVVGVWGAVTFTIPIFFKAKNNIM